MAEPTTEALVPNRQPPARQKPLTRRRLVLWAGVAPFLLYVAFFLLLPIVELIIKSFQSPHGGFTFSNVSMLVQPQYRSAFVASIEVSAISAAGGGLFGLFVSYSAIHGRVPRWIQPLLTTFSGVASNFAGIPLAFAFIATLGPVGVMTVLFNRLGLHIYPRFSIFSLAGLSVTYIYFQLPLMILIIAPSLEGLRKEWREAASNLGATPAQYWRQVGLPVLLPSLAGAMVLLFGNAFSAYATPYALTAGYINLVPIMIGSVLSGNVSVSNPQFGDALALGMIVIIGVTVLAYVWLQRKASKWLQ
jgi:putative spermidine/putrescine transport system permease protein